MFRRQACTPLTGPVWPRSSSGFDGSVSASVYDKGSHRDTCFTSIGFCAPFPPFMQARLQIRNLQAEPLLATSPLQVLGRRRIDQFSRSSLVYFPFPMAPDTKPRGRIKCTYRHSSQYHILKLTALYQNTLLLI